MRFFVSIAIFMAIFAIVYSYPAEVEEQAVAVEEPIEDPAEALLAVDGQGHQNDGDRQARQFGFPGFGYGGYRGGYGGGFGGYRGGYGGYGGYRGGYGGYGGYRGGYGGGYRGGYGGGFYG